METSLEYLSVGGNCHPAAADWSHELDLLAFGAGNNIALWQTNDPSARGIHDLLAAHHGTVQAVRFIHDGKDSTHLVTGSADKSLAVWSPTRATPSSSSHYGLAQRYPDCHNGSINCLAICTGLSGRFASGGADGVVKIWQLDQIEGHAEVHCTQTLALSPSLIPLALSFTQLKDQGVVLAVGGTKAAIQLYATEANEAFHQQASLTGHDGWVRSLDFVRDTSNGSGDILLASASQDKYIRLWRLHEETDHLGHSTTLGASSPALEPLLTNKMHRVILRSRTYSVMFEALLVGHDDWIYSAQWSAAHTKLQLLTASADNSIAIWESDPAEGVWYAVHRFGEISAQKGSTTATGSMGGLWNGLWGPRGHTIIALAKTGGWRRWNLEVSSKLWGQSFGVGGHVKSVRDLSWSRNGSYLLTTSADQTTRLHAQWQRQAITSWHEFSRPQIHGYDLNCISTLGDTSFVSGADEKLLRVFDEPDDVAEMLQKLCDIQAPKHRNLLAADIPVLGLSNKASDKEPDDRFVDEDPRQLPSDAKEPEEAAHPPMEDYLSKRSLWPEVEKLYGHGFEVHTVAISNDGRLVATACRATSIDHAVIRLFNCENWQQIHPPLKAHSLTVTGMQFNSDDSLLLSVGRDRQWVVWSQGTQHDNTFALKCADTKAHSRMILCAAWIPATTQPVFVTGGRDKCMKLWTSDQESFACCQTYSTPAPVLAVAATHSRFLRQSVVSLGLENGDIHVLRLDKTGARLSQPVFLTTNLCPSAAVTQLSWRPFGLTESTGPGLPQHETLAVASEDRSVRLLDITMKDDLD